MSERLHTTSDAKRGAVTLIALLVALPASAHAQTKTSRIEQMPAVLELRFALSALPPAMRGAATVYRLDVGHGYEIAQQGTSGVACLVQRNEWEQADVRDDIYVPRCYDATGSRSYLKVLIDAEALRIRGTAPNALKTEIEARYRDKRYKMPDRAGISYMLSPVMRTRAPDQTVRTMSGPHVMFYAPNVTAADIGTPAGAPPKYPFIVEEGVPEQSFIIQLLGDSERAAIVTDEKPLIDALCSYRKVLCIPNRPSR